MKRIVANVAVLAIAILFCVSPVQAKKAPVLSKKKVTITQLQKYQNQ